MSSKIWKIIVKDDLAKFEKFLKEEDVNLNEYNKEGLTLLLYGIEKGSIECCNYLINDRNVNIFLKDKKTKENALMKCMVIGNDIINISIELLLKNKADINSTDSQNNTPLITSIKRSNEEAARLLIENNADINIKDKNLNSVLHICAKEHLCNVAQLILETKKVDIKNCLNKENNSPLHIAAKENLKNLCDLFLKYNFDETLKNNNNETYNDILKKHEENAAHKNEEKENVYKEKELRKRKNYEQEMLKTDVSNFLKLYNLESLASKFYKHNYIYVDQAFLQIQTIALKKMNISKDERKLFYEAIDKYYEQNEKEKNEKDLEYQRLLEEQKKTKILKYVAHVYSYIGKTAWANIFLNYHIKKQRKI
ncbi:UNC-44 ankyrins [Plasmodium yoelii yoelii]|uniref:UNC-44 ankyrins n=1 Tax=Plasmodium yoelii yoelii TaxID=73239 RepID=Q7RND6_PLAYO|nr:UNC-44 ankyrins [Plasmodium yoelii yoelii]